MSPANQTEMITCPLCRQSAGRLWAEENGFRAEKCGKCGFVYVNPRPVEELISEAVQTGVHSNVRGGHNVVNRRLAKKVSQYRSLLAGLFEDVWRGTSEISWLDIGAGYGEVVEAVQSLAPDGSRIVGIEPMKPKAEHAQSMGLDIRNCYLSDVEERFEYVSLVNVFSHIPDFHHFLQQLKRVLAVNGELFLETGNIGDLSSSHLVPTELDLPDHLVFAGEQNIHQFLDDAGFRVIEVKRIRKDGVIAVAKNVLKKILGRKVAITLPYTSDYRTLLFRARLI